MQLINLPDGVQYILNQLNNNGFEAFVVGGCVRDSLLGKKPKDWDITTSAHPNEVKALFNKTVDTGLQHGTVTVIINKQQFEITTFRIDGKYVDNRRPSNVNFTSSLIEDLSRRDFTINAMAYNYKNGLIDPFNGKQDLENMTIKCVGNAYKRLEKEDRLRKLRAVRFASQLGFYIHQNTYSTIENFSSLDGVSIERIQSEFNKILLSNRIRYGINLLYQLKLLDEFLPEFCQCIVTEQNNPYHIYSVGIHSLIACDYTNLQNELYLKLIVLLHDIGKPMCKTTDNNGIDHFYGHAKYSADIAENILKRMRYDNETIIKAKTLILHHDTSLQDNKKTIRKWLNKIGEDNFRDLLKIRMADIHAQNPKYYQDRYDKIVRIKSLLNEVINNKECFTLKDLNINGKDLIKLGFPQGKIIGKILNKLLHDVMANPELNKKETLISMAKSYKEKEEIE